MWRLTAMETKPNFKTLFASKKLQIILLLLLLLFTLLSYGVLRNSDDIITHKQANRLFTEDKIKKIILDGEYVHIKTADKSYKIYKDAINKNSFFKKYPVEVKEDSTYIYDLLSLLIMLAAIAFLFRFMKQSKLQQLRQIRAAKANDTEAYEPVQALKSNIRFSDVAGIKDVKEELEEIIDFLREPKKYRDMDIRLPKGVLLVGPPGVGKTFISKAVAGEAGVPFFYQSGASFVHIYVGMGAKRVSELFKKAKQMAPSIIFIDEIDAVGKSRGEFRNDEREATLNQLLTEMDGFEESAGVIVIGATNKIDVLDEALLRAGRFDRRIHISLPDLEDEKEWQEAINRVKELPLTHVHAFSYSKRDNTVSATMKPEIRGNIAKERHRELTAIIKAKNYAFRREHTSDLEVLLETGKEGVFSGFDQYFNKVEVQSTDDLSSNWVFLNNVEVDSNGNKAKL